MSIVFDVKHIVNCPTCHCHWDGYYTDDDICDSCDNGKKEVYHRLHVETTSDDPKDRPNLTCHISWFCPSWKKTPVDGDQFTRGKNYTTKLYSFDFTFTTDDSDVMVFEPHIDFIVEILNLTELMKLRTQIVTSNAIGKKKALPRPTHADELKVLSAEEKKVLDFMKVTKTELRWVQPIVHTLINAVYRTKVRDVSDAMKPCPHVKR